MKIDKNKSIVTMEDGTIYHTHSGILGLGTDGNIYQGCDGLLDFYHTNGQGLIEKHRIEIAEYMIESWTKFLQQCQKIVEGE